MGIEGKKVGIERKKDRQACFKAVSLKPIMRALCLKRGGAHPRIFMPCKLASNHVGVFWILSREQSVCKWGGGLRPPNQSAVVAVQACFKVYEFPFV